MKKTKTFYSLLTAGGSFVIIGSTLLVGSYLITNNNNEHSSEDKPLNRGDDYYHYEIKKYISDQDLTNIISTKIINNKYIKCFDKTYLNKNLKETIKNIIGSIDRFKSSIDNYVFEINYKIIQDTTLLIDVVWYIKTIKPIYYYDQLSIKIVHN